MRICFADYETSEYNQRNLANNTKLEIIAYGIIAREANLTELLNPMRERLRSPVVYHQTKLGNLKLNTTG